jgi:hypothetical protein
LGPGKPQLHPSRCHPEQSEGSAVVLAIAFSEASSQCNRTLPLRRCQPTTNFRIGRPTGQISAEAKIDSLGARPARKEPMLITNKHKSSKKHDNKTDAIRRIRRSPIESTLGTGSMRKRHDQSVCPICFAPIKKTASGGRRKHWCTECGATLNKVLMCDSCSTARVWQGPRGAACVGCGSKYGARSAKRRCEMRVVLVSTPIEKSSR